jgi:hypothetical protein
MFSKVWNEVGFANLSLKYVYSHSIIQVPVLLVQGFSVVTLYFRIYAEVFKK